MDVSEGKYGNYPLIQSTGKPDITYDDIKDVTLVKDGKETWVRARMFTSRLKGKNLCSFLIEEHFTKYLVIVRFCWLLIDFLSHLRFGYRQAVFLRASSTAVHVAGATFGGRTHK